jgi:hypothetical protein
MFLRWKLKAMGIAMKVSAVKMRAKVKFLTGFLSGTKAW